MSLPIPPSYVYQPALPQNVPNVAPNQDVEVIHEPVQEVLQMNGQANHPNPPLHGSFVYVPTYNIPQ